MRPLRYSINVTLDGCCHHEAGLPPDEESMRYWIAEMERADALLFGRVTYEMMESAWRKPATGTWPDWMDEWQIPFAETIDRAKKYVVSSTLSGVDVDWKPAAILQSYDDGTLFSLDVADDQQSEVIARVRILSVQEGGKFVRLGVLHIPGRSVHPLSCNYGDE